MRIAVDLTALADNLSGLERYAMNIVKEMVLMDHQSHYILLFKNEVCSGIEMLTDCPNVEIRVYHGGSKLVFSQLKLPVYLYKEKKIDKYLFLAFPCPILFRAKGIYTLIADMVAFDCPQTMKPKARIFFRQSIRHSWRVSEKIVTISEFSRSRILAKFGQKKVDEKEKKIILAYCGISEEFSKHICASTEQKQRIREKYHLPEQYFLCLSTLEPRKNLPLLVQAYGEALERTEDASELPDLVLAGRKGWMIDELLSQIHEKYRDKICMTGFIDDADLPEIYQMADCFVFPTIYEGFGMPPLEALAVGTPVISSDAACMKEVLGNHAVFFENRNKDALVMALLNQVSNQVSNQVNNQGQTQTEDEKTDHFKRSSKYVNEQFNWKKSAEIILGEMNKTN